MTATFTFFMGTVDARHMNVFGDIPITDANLDHFLGNGHIQPVHPGILFRRWVMERGKLDLSVVAERSGIAPDNLNRVLEGNAPVTEDIAVGFARVAGDEPGAWTRGQRIFDLWMARKTKPAHPRP